MGAQCWESVHSYIKQIDEELGGYGDDYHGGYGNGWDAGVKYKEAVKRAIHGDKDLVSLATDTMRKVVPPLDDTLRACNQRTVAGSRVSVPTYLGGSPRCMVRRVKAERTMPHVNIFVGIVSSCGFSADDLLKRGATILALLETLQACQVGVNVYLLSELDGDTSDTGDYVQCIRVESQPLDLSTASFAIAHPAFARNVTYAYAAKFHNYRGGWPRNRPNNWVAKDGKLDAAQQKWFDLMRKWGIPIHDQDIYIPAPYLTDPIMKTPEKWLEDRLHYVIKGNS